MATLGFPGDINNSIPITGAYPIGRAFGYVPPAGTSFDMRNNYAGEIGGLNQDYRGALTTNAQMATTRTAPNPMARNGNGNGTGKKPAAWFVVFAIIFVLIAWAARRFAPDGEQFAIIKPNLINWLFITLTVILTMALLKQVAIRIKPIPGVSALADLILSV